MAHALRLPGDRPFKLLMAGLATSSCGDWLYNVALLALVFERTGSPTFVAITTAARIVPTAIAPGPWFRPARTGETPTVLADIRAGAQALRGAPIALRFLGADLMCSAVYGLLTVTLVLVSRRAGAGTDGYGILLGAFGLGGL